jgi:hypothetical protein
MKKVFVLSKVEMFAVLTVGILTAFSQTAQAIPADVVKPAVEDKVKFAFEPANFRETTYEDGWINDRMQINVDKRLVTLDLDLLLEPFNQRPGVQWWVGEHIGKFLHAASYSYQFTGDERLKKRMKYAVKELISTQLPNGYLGTYEEHNQFFQGTTSLDCLTITRLQATNPPLRQAGAGQTFSMTPLS